MLIFAKTRYMACFCLLNIDVAISIVNRLHTRMRREQVRAILYDCGRIDWKPCPMDHNWKSIVTNSYSLFYYC